MGFRGSFGQGPHRLAVPVPFAANQCAPQCAVHSSRGATEPILFSGQHFDELASTTAQRPQGRSHVIRQGAQPRAHRFGERANI